MDFILNILTLIFLVILPIYWIMQVIAASVFGLRFEDGKMKVNWPWRK